MLTQQSVELHEDQVDWLNKARETYNIPDLDKALRVLLDFAMEDGDETEIFEKIRCRHC